MPRGVGNENDWLLSVSLDTVAGTARIRAYRDHLRRSASRTKDNRRKKWIVREQKMATKLASDISRLKTKGIACDVVRNAGQRLYKQVLAAWRAEMSPRTYAYINAINMSGMAKAEDGRLFIGIGNWKHLMKATSLDHSSEIKHTAMQSWIKPKYGTRRPSYGPDKALAAESERMSAVTKQRQYIATRGPLAGQPITGYWYFQEAGFIHHISKQFIHHPVFSSMDMNIVGDQMVNDFGRKIHQHFKRSGRYVSWVTGVVYK